MGVMNDAPREGGVDLIDGNWKGTHGTTAPPRIMRLARAGRDQGVIGQASSANLFVTVLLRQPSQYSAGLSAVTQTRNEHSFPRPSLQRQSGPRQRPSGH